ncbi:hypothetical protein B0H13DRAFT_2336685 [Mycena leptocephala]|nr:hypothetical protein B0H13DRAFT_2336685 [Mycena leptocephala]
MPEIEVERPTTSSVPTVQPELAEPNEDSALPAAAATIPVNNEVQDLPPVPTMLGQPVAQSVGAGLNGLTLYDPLDPQFDALGLTGWGLDGFDWMSGDLGLGAGFGLTCPASGLPNGEDGELWLNIVNIERPGVLQETTGTGPAEEGPAPPPATAQTMSPPQITAVPQVTAESSVPSPQVNSAGTRPKRPQPKPAYRGKKVASTGVGALVEDPPCERDEGGGQQAERNQGDRSEWTEELLKAFEAFARAKSWGGEQWEHCVTQLIRLEKAWAFPAKGVLAAPNMSESRPSEVEKFM